MPEPRTFATVSKGFIAGVIGTAAMTASEKLEQAWTGREDSTIPTEVGALVVKPELQTGADAQQLGQAVHWTHGITWGAIRGLLAMAPLSASTASALHYVSLWTSDATLYRVLGIEPLPHKWERQALLADLFHKLVLSGVTSAAFLALTMRGRRRHRARMSARQEG